MALTPMMQQYHDAKQAVGDALLLFRMGDFYELFHEDAKRAARLLGLSLTSRDKTDNPIPMAGFPHHQLEGYLAKIIAAGLRAAVCDQTEDPKQAKGLVRRDVTRVVSPGTVTDEGLLQPHASNFLLALALSGCAHDRSDHAAGLDPRAGLERPAGLAWVDLSTGRFEATTVPTKSIEDELARIQPVELILPEDLPEPPTVWSEGRMITRRPDWAFSAQAADEALGKHFGTQSLDGFGFEASDGPALQAAGAILDYLSETQKSSLAHIDRIRAYRSNAHLEIDQATRRSLEISQTMLGGSREGSLWGVIDRTVTSPGARLLGDWLANPLTDVAAIEARQGAVAELHADPLLCGGLRDGLRTIYDLQRLLARVTAGRATPRDLSFISRTLGCLPPIKSHLADRRSDRLAQLEPRIDPCVDLRQQLEAALEANCPLTSREGAFIRAGFHEELDQQRILMSGGKKWIAQYQAEAVQRSGIPNIKVGFNRVFGYYLEVTHAQLDKVPEDFIRKQTLKNAERYITPELKEHEEKVLAAEDRCKELEYELFVQLRDLVAAAAGRLQMTAEAIAEVDVLAALAELARARNYVRPKMTDQPVLEITDGRHPVLDITEPEGTFVPNGVSCGATPDACGAPSSGAGANDASSNSETDRRQAAILLITGPNMSGKSTYIRQVALITLMAQIGSFVPASEAVIGVTDRIFARVGASDELSRGRSTFMVEMTETARILNTATSRSLVILDEIGRGTSTYDGLSLAWAVVEHLHNQIGCRTLFATHYHELTDLESTLASLANYNVSVREWQDKVVFLHQIVAGSADKSYGIHVARLAGVPPEVNRRAEEILAQLEKQHAGQEQSDPVQPGPQETDPVQSVPWQNGEHPSPNTGPDSPATPGRSVQRSLFATDDHPLLETIREVNLNRTTPMESLELVQQWQQQLAAEDAGSKAKPR